MEVRSTVFYYDNIDPPSDRKHATQHHSRPSMPLSIFDSGTSNLSTQSAPEAYTHAMQAHTLSQISFLGLSENHEISDRNTDDGPTSGHPLRPTKPLSIFETSASNDLTQSAMEAYTDAMQAYTLSQISSLDLGENLKILNRHSSEVLYGGAGLRNAAEAEEAARQAAKDAEFTRS